jgi:tetratricopeptide (TPR) repeat protein
VSAANEPTGSLEVAMKHATNLLAAQPALAAEQAQEILKAVPNHAPAAFLLARANACIGRGDDAIEALRRTVKLKPDHPEAWRLLADHLMAIGDTEGADAAYLWHVKASTKNPELLQAAGAMVKKDLPRSEALLKAHLMKAPTDVPAIRMLAEVAARLGRDDDAIALLDRCLELAPSFTPALYNYAVLLNRRNQSARALPAIEKLLAAEPRHPGYRNFHAVLLSRLGDYERAARIYAELLREYPSNAKVWLSYGHTLKTEGDLQEGVAAYRRSISLEPAFGEAYWSLANLKTFRFEPAEVATMEMKAADPTVGDVDRLHLHFALGKAYEDGGDWATSFSHYEKANALQRARLRYDPDRNTERLRHLQATLTRDFFAARAGLGCPSPDPIFIVGLPRAGSTLIEQILSSHSGVEGTMELPEIISMARELRARSESQAVGAYTDVLAAMDAAKLRELGERFIEQTRAYRKTGRPFFIDKMPNNFLHIGMIHLVLPNAKIIDARRHPLACCFSNYRQHFASGQRFAYDLADLGRYYRDYVDLMAHFDAVLPPGRIHRVIYERMVEDTEAEVRRLLEYCGLPFEDNCLRFFETERPVRTPSSEQVRQPIYREAVDQWRHYEAWLEPLKTALGPALAAYRDVPVFDQPM